MQNTELHIIDFKTQSIVATFQDQDYWDDMREWELKNNVDILEFKVFDGTRQAIALQQQNLVLRQDREGNVIPYTIEDEVEKTAKDRSITVRAVGSWTGLRKAGFIRPQKLEGLTAHQYVSLATAGTKWQPGNIAYASFRTMTLDEFTDPLTLLKKVATLFNLELNYRVEVDGNTITGWFVDLVEKIGRVTRKEIELGKDLINVTRIEHTKNICTALIGFARGEDNEVITIEKINNGSPYIVDNEAFQRWSENGQHKFGFYQPETEGEIDAKRLMTLMKTEMEKRKNSSVGYEVDALDIAEVFGLRHELIMKGDTIGIKDTAFIPALYLEARAIGGKESNTNPDRNKYTFGEYHEIVDYDAEMRRMYNRVQGLLENKAGKPMLDQLNKLVQEQEKKMNEVVETNQRVTEITEKLEEMVTNNSVTIHDGPNAPTEGLKEGKSLWLDTSNGKPGILKIWRGGKWEAVTEDFSGLEKEIRDQVAKDVDEKTKQLNKSVSDMETRAGEVEKKAEALDKEVKDLKGGYQSLDKITKEIKETERGTQETLQQLKVNGEKVDQTIISIGKSLDGFNQSISQIKKDAEATSKTIVQQQQTLNGFDQSIKNLVKKDSEINETLVQQQQTINGFTNEISQLKKTDGELKETTVKQQQTINGISNSIAEVNKNISGQSQKINTLESTVDGNKRLIQSVEKDLTATKNDFTKQTTEIKEKAGEISTKLEKVEARTVGGENWFIYTGPNEKPQTIGMLAGALVNKAKFAVQPGEYIVLECSDHTDSFYQFHLDNTKMGDYEKGKDMTVSLDLQNDVHVDFILFQFINGAWSENVQKGIPASNVWKRESWTFNIDTRATGWGLRLRFARNTNSVGKRIRMKKTKLEKGSVPTDFSKSTYELEQSFNGVKERIEKTESIVNDAGDRNYVRNGDFTHYWADNGLGWDKALNGNLRAGNWGTGYNAGVVNATKGYHMHVNDKKFGYPVIAVINKNAPIVGAKRWLGIAQEMPPSFKNDFQPGDNVTISLDVWTETTNNKLAVGLHHFIEGNNSQSFHSGGTPELTINPIKKWVRVHTTVKLHAKTEMKKAFSLYVYGDRSPDGHECYFKNVSIIKGSMPKAFAPSPEDGVKEVLFNQKVVEITKDADGIKSNVKNLTDLTTKHGQQITSSETKIKQLSDEVSAKMTSKQVQDYVAGVGATNILRNAGLRTDMKTLYFGLTSGTVVDVNSKFGGQNTFWSVKTGRTADDWQGAISNRYPCQGGENFVASGWFSTDNASTIDNGVFMEVEHFDAKGTRVKTDRVQVQGISPTWQKVVLPFTMHANAVNVTWRFYVQRNGRARVALPMLQRGKVASEFQLNPADISDVDALREDIAQRIATEQFNKVVTEINREIKANKDGILLKADASKVYTKQQSDGTFAKESHVKTLEGKISVNEKNINLSVKENNIIAKINVTKETILLDAKRINLVGAITAQHFQANTIKGVKYESHNPKDATNRVVIENSVVKSFGPLDKARNVQNYAELKEGGLHVYEVAPNGSPYGGKHVEVLPGRLNVTSDRWSSAIEPSEFRIWAPGNLMTIALGEVPLGENGYGMRLTAPEGIFVKSTLGNTRPTIQFEPSDAIYFDGFGNIVGGKYSKDWATFSIKDGQGRTKYITGIGNGSAQTTEYNSYGGGHAFNHNGTRLFATWIQGANFIQQFGGHAIFKWQHSANRFEFRTGNDGGWVNASAGSFQNASSLVWKKDINNFEGSALEIIMGTNIMTYRYKNVELEPFVDVDGKVIESNHEMGEAVGPVRVGVISEFAPKLITNEDGSAVDLYAMISLGWKGIQENQKAIQDKDKRLNDQETRIKDQEVTIKNQSDRISNLETKLNQVLELLGKE
ncbi:phage tail spike protein [Bacillus wiedmannii]|uniref:phage tail spike protein n=1 Tax=Bacillus wiedmannii TaxID=1890302 RepID=UPI0025A30251|nr:phage tail spike protein [Bacillus wiedmannii]MDM5266960.1 phage tail spike protein [Bacillus wiedmannii]